MKKLRALFLLILISLMTVATFHVNSTSNSSTKTHIITAVDDDDDDFLPTSTPANPLRSPGSNG